MAGKIIGAIFNLLNAIFLTSWSRWVWLATVMPIQNISGGYLTFIMMTYSFIADNSTNRSLQDGHKKGFMLNAFLHILYIYSTLEMLRCSDNSQIHTLMQIFLILNC